MKKILRLITLGLIVVPFMYVNAGELGCTSSIIDNSSDYVLECKMNSCNNLSYKDNDTKLDYREHFGTCKVENDVTKITIKKTLKFDTSKEIGHVLISNGTDSSVISILNQAYVKPVETTTTTTTTSLSKKTYTVTLDPNNGESKETKTCDVTGTNETCTVTLPTKSDTTFTGWGKAKTCTTGNTGSIKVNSDITYYACYSNQTSSKEVIYLNSLKISNDNKTINFGAFSKKKNEYNAKVLYEVENIDVLAEADEGVTIVTDGNENLKVGENKITITLTGENNVTNNYTINVTRLKKGEALSNINYLKSLVIGGNYNINFNKDTFTYNLEIDKDVNNLEITAIAEDDSIIPKINNNKNLVNGSVIEIALKSENGNETVYKINIIKDSKTTLILFGAAAIIILLILLLIIMIIIKSNKKKKNINSNIPQEKKSKSSKKKKDEDIEVLDL